MPSTRISAFSVFLNLLKTLEKSAPFSAGLLLLICGILAALYSLNWIRYGGPLARSGLPGALLVFGAGVGILLAAWESHRTRQQLNTAHHDLLRAQAQRDLAMLQSRRIRTQTEGLSLMREIHRSTAIPDQHERMHRILILIADLFEAREVSLFAAVTVKNSSTLNVQPAACLRATNKEEFFINFDLEELNRQSYCDLTVDSAPQDKDNRLKVLKNSATIEREGCRLFVKGTLAQNDNAVAQVQWRRGAQSQHDALSSSDPTDILKNALAKIDCSPQACTFAAQALERRRTVRREVTSPNQNGTPDGLILCVPLIADQKPIGVLRIYRSLEGFNGQEAEALEELLIESGKHIALALKKDDDDRKAITDVLTSLYIKRHFLQTLEKLRAESVSDGKIFSLILCDIDHFKKVNDTHGHLSGDMILKGVAGVLRKELRTGDTAFRYGGEEMALLLPNATPQAAEQTAERLRIAVEEAIFKGELGQVVPITISLGVAQFQSVLTGDALISRADRALYASKHNGRNQVTLWTSALPDPLEKTHRKPVAVASL